MTHQDICACFEGDTLLAIQVSLYSIFYKHPFKETLWIYVVQIILLLQAPIGTQLGVEVIPEVTGNIGGSLGKDSLVAKKRYQMHLKSLEGQIYVLLVNKDSDNEQPLVVQVSSWSTINYGIYFDTKKFLSHGNSNQGMIGF